MGHYSNQRELLDHKVAEAGLYHPGLQVSEDRNKRRSTINSTLLDGSHCLGIKLSSKGSGNWEVDAVKDNLTLYVQGQPVSRYILETLHPLASTTLLVSLVSINKVHQACNLETGRWPALQHMLQDL
jgi:hypothetical protein